MLCVNRATILISYYSRLRINFSLKYTEYKTTLKKDADFVY